jgi:CRISPR-associated protein Cmx8
MTEETVQLTYQLGQLPSPSYRAGLAGLIFLMNFLHRNQPDMQEQIEVKFDSISATLQCTKTGLQALLDLTFDSEYVLNWTEKKRSGSTPAKIEETEQGNRYGYEDLKVKGKALQERDSSGIWTSLWSDWLLKTVRAIPKSRDDFKLRARNQSIKVDNLWNALQKPEGKIGLSSSALIGAEAKTCEGVNLNDTNAQEFLLNFWAYVSQPYVPCRFDTDGKREDWGYTVAIPDVQDLKAFVEQYPDILERRPQNPPEYKGYRPLGALIELPEEAALDSIWLIRQYMEESQIASSLEFDVLGFEICHAVRPDPKRGADLISIAYIQPDSERDRHYANYRKKFLCPWFRRHLLQNLVKNRPWTARWGELLSIASQKWFEHRFFPHDCKLVFNLEENLVETSELIQILKSLCDRYLNARLAVKGQEINWESKHKLARQEFLAVRARPQKDAFRKYFFENLCSQVNPIHLKRSLSSEEYEALSKDEKRLQTEQQNIEKIRQMLLLHEALEKDSETIRGLTMLALASNFQFSDRSNSSSS